MSRQHYQIGNTLVTGSSLLEAMFTYLDSAEFGLLDVRLEEDMEEALNVEHISGKEYHERLTARRGPIQ